MRPSVMMHFFPMLWSVMGRPRSQKKIHLRQFNLGSLIHLFIFAMFFSSPALGYMCTYNDTLLVLFSTQVIMSCHTSADQMGFPLHCQLVFFHWPSNPHRVFATIHKSMNTGHFSHSAVFEESWMAFSSAIWPPCPATASAIHCVRLHMAAFHLQLVPIIWQERALKREHCFLFSGSWFYGGASLAWWHLFLLLFWWYRYFSLCATSWWFPRSLGDWDFLFELTVRSEWSTYSTWHQWHVCRTEFPLDIPFSTVSQGARKYCASVSITSESSSSPFVTCQDLFFSWGVTGLTSSLSPNPESRLSWSLHGYFFVRDSRKDHASQLQCRAHFSHFILTGPRATALTNSCLICPKLLFVLVEDPTYNCSPVSHERRLTILTILWNKHPAKPSVPKKAFVSFLMIGHIILDDHIHWTLITSILPFYT